MPKVFSQYVQELFYNSFYKTKRSKVVEILDLQQNYLCDISEVRDCSKTMKCNGKHHLIPALKTVEPQKVKGVKFDYRSDILRLK